MSRGRHAILIAAAGLPALVALLVATGASGTAGMAAASATWVLTVALVHTLVWQRYGAPAATLLEELETSDAASAHRLVHDLKDEAASCRRHREQLAGLLEDLSSSLGEGLLVVTSDLRIRLINPVMQRFCGVNRSDEGVMLLEILRDPAAVEAIEIAARGELPSPVLTENARGLWELRSFPVRDGGAVALVSDVSLVRRSAEFRRRFVQDLSHELRSPLAVMRTTVEAVEDEISPALAEILVRQVERLDRLTRELFELASIEAGQVELELEVVPVAAIAAEVLRDFGPEAERVGVALRQRFDDDLSCRCDRRGLYRVLSNLVDNAVKYNRRSGWVEVRARREGAAAVVEVADSGEGIPASELQAVLQRFYRVDRARTPGRGGLGLGLAIVKHMVQHMGGSLRLDSREGVGTTVTLSFPAATPPG